ETTFISAVLTPGFSASLISRPWRHRVSIAESDPLRAAYSNAVALIAHFNLQTSAHCTISQWRREVSPFRLTNLKHWRSCSFERSYLEKWDGRASGKMVSHENNADMICSKSLSDMSLSLV